MYWCMHNQYRNVIFLLVTNEHTFNQVIKQSAGLGQQVLMCPFGH